MSCLYQSTMTRPQERCLIVPERERIGGVVIGRRPAACPAGRDGEPLGLLAFVLVASEKVRSDVGDARLADIIAAFGIEHFFDDRGEAHLLPSGPDGGLALPEARQQRRLKDNEADSRLVVEELTKPCPATREDSGHRGTLLREDNGAGGWDVAWTATRPAGHPGEVQRK